MTSDEELADMLDEAPAPRRRRGRPPNNAAKKLEAPAEQELPEWTEFLKPVNVSFLMDVFRMDRRSVMKKLVPCPIARMGGGNKPLYDFTLAAAHLVKPQIDIGRYLKNMKPTELPSYLQDQWWAAQLKRQQWEEKAGNLWRTEDVIEVFGDVFQVLKTTIQLWADNVEQLEGLDPAQREILVKATDGLQQEMHRKLIEMPKEKRTGSSKEELRDALPDVGE